MDWRALGSALHQLVLPALVLGFSVMAPLTRMVRATMLEVLESDYIKAAWAAGLPRRTVIYGDALRNCMIPVITLIGVVFGFLMAGNVVVESVFAWPGIGNYAVAAMMSKDSGPIQSFVLFVGVVYVFVNLAVDLVYGLVDPRIRLRDGRAGPAVRLLGAAARTACRWPPSSPRPHPPRGGRALMRPTIPTRRRRSVSRAAGGTGSAPISTGATSSRAWSTRAG
jgi:hypothetical protein